jgi:hypothetical protein
VWKIIEEKEIWVPSPGAIGPGELVPALALRFWRIDDRQQGKGKPCAINIPPVIILSSTIGRFWKGRIAPH